jgi:hypothetical protein
MNAGPVGDKEVCGNAIGKNPREIEWFAVTVRIHVIV